eukprot:TRINITY_DN24372_c0_g1_i1.p1 TRINITY_DN24372_c0_g1~~TRINITY_DN24372_c0_g1_i1.p1  ORF type:complete len:219 (-),score=31.34 TRINITY_DN24372_c0_g1_i1:113-769(-)
MKLEVARILNESSCSSCGKRFCVEKVERVENPTLFKQYLRGRDTIKDWRRRSGVGTGSLARIKAIEPQLENGIFDLARRNLLDIDGANEVYLVHGTKWDLVDIITYKEGFDERVARGGLYGEGIYTAEQACKSNQYTEINGVGQRLLFICRVVLGCPKYTSTTLSGRRPVDTGKEDSVIANRGTVQGGRNGWQHHREFIVYDRHQIYPEFMVTYKLFH